ncbi:MAG: FadR/GntR family transcriptional regulator [Bacteroidia bacterium]
MTYSFNVSNIFQEIQVEKPSDKIIQQIRELIRSGQLKPGDKLPPERKLVEQFGVGRGHVREALRKLEFYGILKTLPQSGTVVEGLGVKALEGLITDVLELEKPDFYSLVETRFMLEVNSVRLAAERRTEQDLASLEEALSEFAKKVENGEQGVEEDLMFHLKIADASKNTVLRSLTMIVIPDMIRFAKELDICGNGRFLKALEEHRAIFQEIKAGNPDGAAEAMKAHLKDMLDHTQKPNF